MASDAERADRMLANIDRLKGLVVRIGWGPDHPVLVVDASALMAEDDLGPREWWLYPEPDDEWSHGPSGTKAKLGEALWGIACCYEPAAAPREATASPEKEVSDG